MATIEVKDAAGKKVEDRDLNATVFGIEPNIHAVTVVRSACRIVGTTTRLRPAAAFAAAARSRGARRAPAVPARVPSVPRTGRAVAWSSARIRVPTRSA